MTRSARHVAASEDTVLIRALGRGDERALESLLERHLQPLYGLLRMALPTGAEAEAALTDTFCAAIERADDPLAQTEPARWLAGIALEQVGARAAPRPPSSLEERRRQAGPGGGERPAAERSDRLGPESIAGISDSALATLIRTLDLHSRQAIVLGVICGMEDGRVAAVIGCESWEIERLTERALKELTALLAGHERRAETLKRQIEAVPYRLRPVPVMGTGRGPSGSTVVVGSKVHLEPVQPKSILMLVRRAFHRIAELFRRHQQAFNPEDEAGDSSEPRAIERTPTQQQFERPAPTPTTRGFRTPKLSPGVAVYAMPRNTPTTKRLSSGKKPLPPSGR